MRPSPYATTFVPVGDLDEALRRDMARLYLDSYDGSSQSIFFHDLARKDEALLVYDGARLIGFTTLWVFERQWRGERIRVVYSGDTVVDRAH